MLKELYLNFKFKLLQARLIKAGANVVDTDPENLGCLVSFADGIDTYVSLSEDGHTIQFESTIIFDTHLANLQTLSNIAHGAFFLGLRSTGISYKNGNQVKIYIGKDINFISLLFDFEEHLADMHEGIVQIAEYLYIRSTQLEGVFLDLSMFDELTLAGFDPRRLGEEKELVHKTWTNYIKALLQAEDIDALDITDLIAELQACAEFESTNGMSLAEVGDDILREILWNRQFTKMHSQDKYSVN